MRGCIDSEEPECDGESCYLYGICCASLEMMLEDSSLREEFLRNLKIRDGEIQQRYTTYWRRFLRKKRRRGELNDV